MNKFYVSLMLAINVAGISIAEAGTDLGYSDFAVVIPLMQNEIDNPELFKCSKLIGKYQLPKSVKSQEIVKGDIYEVLLKRVHISDHYRPDFLQFSKGGKIAILANGFEMQSGGNGALGGFDYSRSSAGDSRVIYFSEDVRAGQFLEFGQIIMFGPAEYHGNPLGVSLFGLEVMENYLRPKR